ncbi:MAG TPA: hypothetical protein VK727_08220 [Steroidobacteraceae bacterium]|nr:hypothetical protein [Steroidobacteraceae bacterium]
MKTSTKRLMTLAVCGAGLGLANAAAAQQQAPAASGPATFASLSPEQQQAQQAIDNKIVRPPVIDLGRRNLGKTPQQIAAELAAMRKGWEPTPPPADLRDFTGAWAMINGRLDLVQDDGNQAPFTAAEAKSTQALIKAEADGKVVTDASTQCFPHGTPRLIITPGYPIRFVYLPGEIVMLHEVAHNVRIIHMDQKEAPKGTPRTFLGYSVGHWEGNTLVVETSHMNEKTRLDSVTSHGPNLKVIERFTREKTSDGHTDLVVRITIDDPDHFYKVFSISRKLGFRSDLASTEGSEGITEYSCEENNRNEPNAKGIVKVK